MKKVLILLAGFVLSGVMYSQSNLPICSTSVSVWTNCIGTETLPNGEQYVGEFKDDKFHGQGTYTFADGTKYVGEWKDGEKIAGAKEKLESKKDKCRSYGFKDDTDGMGMCLIELDKLAELEKQTKSIQANSIAQAEAFVKQEAEEKNRREAQALINLGNYLSGKGGASCSFKCSGGQVVQGSCKSVNVKVGNQTCWKQ